MIAAKKLNYQYLYPVFENAISQGFASSGWNSTYLGEQVLWGKSNTKNELQPAAARNKNRRQNCRLFSRILDY